MIGHGSVTLLTPFTFEKNSSHNALNHHSGRSCPHQSLFLNENSDYLETPGKECSRGPCWPACLTEYQRLHQPVII